MTVSCTPLSVHFQFDMFSLAAPGPSQTAQTLRMHRVASEQSFENAEAAAQVAAARSAKFNLQRTASRLLRESDLVRLGERERERELSEREREK